MGMKLVGVIEKDGSIFNPEGIDVNLLKVHFDRHQTLKGLAGAESFEDDTAMFKKCDFFIPTYINHLINECKNVFSL